MTPPPTPATTQSIDITLATNSSGHLLFFMNDISFRGNYDHPILLLAKLGNTSYPNDPQWNVYNFGSNATIRFVIRNRTPLAHPMHLHGHNFWVLAEGLGPWDGTVTNPQNPQRRDVQLLQGTPDSPGYLVIQIDADNPGVWPLHCHISW
jgi:FtsP/CotA-like multicopper oxidase with cupredoxin domain